MGDLSDLFSGKLGLKVLWCLKVLALVLHRVVFTGHHKESEFIVGTISPELWKGQSLCAQILELVFTKKL